jgi:hypothetical protein
MLKEYKAKTNFGIGLAFAIWIIGGGLIGIHTEERIAVVKILGFTPFLYGCCCYAKGKGHSGYWGLLSILSLFGLIILICFKDRCKNNMEKSTTNSEDLIYRKGISQQKDRQKE